MRLFGLKEVYMISYEKEKEGIKDFDTLLSMFVSEKDPCVRGVEENPCEYGYIVDDETNNILEDVFCRLDKRSKNKSVMNCLKVIGSIIKENKTPLTLCSVKDLYLKLHEEGIHTK